MSILDTVTTKQLQNDWRLRMRVQRAWAQLERTTEDTTPAQHATTPGQGGFTEDECRAANRSYDRHVRGRGEPLSAREMDAYREYGRRRRDRERDRACLCAHPYSAHTNDKCTHKPCGCNAFRRVALQRRPRVGQVAA